MMINKTKNLDELQIIKRGNVFKHGLFIALGLLLINSALYAYGVEWAPDGFAELTIVIVTIVFCSIEFIYHDIYPLKIERQKYVIYLTGIYGIVSIAISVYDLIRSKNGIILNGRITESALSIIYGCLMIAILLAYLIKTNYNMHHLDDE